MFIITYPYTSSSYSTFYNKAIIIFDDVANTYHKFDPITQTYTTPKASECKADFRVYGNGLTSISDLVRNTGYYNGSCIPYGFATLEEATLAKLHLLSQLSAEIHRDLARLQLRYAEACPPSLTSAYDTFKLNYPEVFL
jgi:hypothetical protein